MKNSTLLNSQEVCEYLKISKATLWRYVASGKIPQPKRLSRSILLWNKSTLDESLGLIDEVKGGAENE